MIDFLVDISIKTGVVIIPLFLTGLFGWYLLIDVYHFLQRQEKPSKVISKKRFIFALDNDDFSRINRELNQRKKSFYAKFLAHLIREKDYSDRHIDQISRFYVIKNLSSYTININTVQLLASVAPLMGLWGTVNGMINTFEIISLYGNANPVLMADGISESLLTTQAGLVVAFPLLFTRVVLSNKLKKLKHSMLDVATEVKNHNKLGNQE